MEVVMLWLMLGVAVADPTLSVSGVCPGPIDIVIGDLTPRGRFAVLRGVGLDDDTLAAGPCAGLRTGLAGIRLQLVSSSDDGTAAFRPTLGADRCSAAIQVLDVVSCTLSEAVLFGGGGGDPGDARAFGTCGAAGATGPDVFMCDAAYAGSSLEAEVDVSGGIQSWSVPATGAYRIEAHGAQGGTSEEGAQGRGAHVEGTFDLVAGDTLRILVGQMGSSGTTYDYGGGGGTFVALADDTPLIVAGGGGTSGNCGDGVVSDLEGGKSVEGSGAGGFGGNDGSWCGCGGDGSPGGGFLTDGFGDGAGMSFLSGGAGAVGVRPGQCVDAGVGGFGGGGNSGNGGAGGGGYGGGDAGSGATGTHRGSGGASYNAGLGPFGADAANEGDGRVVITPL
ncbi:MAG: hypothetical protein ACI8PZ_002054 [Myxococcota bacterium]